MCVCLQHLTFVWPQQPDDTKSLLSSVFFFLGPTSLCGPQWVSWEAPGPQTWEGKRKEKENKSKQGPCVIDWSRWGGTPPPPPRCRLLPHPGGPGRSGSVEHDGLWIEVGHLSHVTKNIFFCDNTKQAPAGGDTEEEQRHGESLGGSGRLNLQWKEKTKHVFVGSVCKNNKKKFSLKEKPNICIQSALVNCLRVIKTNANKNTSPLERLVRRRRWVSSGERRESGSEPASRAGCPFKHCPASLRSEVTKMVSTTTGSYRQERGSERGL